MSDVTNFERAIYQMMRDPTYCTLAVYLLDMEIIADDKVGTAATDCVRKVWYSPKYFENSSVEECKAALVHEVYHPFLNFFPRFERWAKRYPNEPRRKLLDIFNRAQDYFINWIVKHEWNLPIRDSWLYNADYTPNSYTSERIADKLLLERNTQPPSPPPPQPADSEQGDGSPDNESAPSSDGTDESPDDSPEDTEDHGGGGGGGEEDDGPAQAGAGEDIRLPEEYDGDIDNVLSEEQINKMETENRTASANASRMAKPARGSSRGDGSGDPFTTAIDGQNYMARHDWAAQLHHYANNNTRSGTHTYARPSTRRRTAQGAMYPGPVGKALGTIVFAIDSSGSTSGQMVNYFFAEMEHALATAQFDKAVVIWCSEGIPQQGVFEYTKADVGKMDRRIRSQGGGTEFMPVFERVARDYPDAACLTYLTDGGVHYTAINECHRYWSANLRGLPVVWALADLGWGCTEAFTQHCNKIGFGVVAELPMHEVMQQSN